MEGKTRMIGAARARVCRRMMSAVPQGFRPLSLCMSAKAVQAYGHTRGVFNIRRRINFGICISYD
jgi:hypothetical protein